MEEIILKIRYFERGLSKSLKNVKFIFFFRTQPLLMGMIMKEKRSLKLMTGRSSGYKTSSEKVPYQ